MNPDISRGMGLQPPIVTADLYDAHHKILQVCTLQFRSFGRHVSFFGPCATLSNLEDHTPVLKAVKTAGFGRVLVVDAQGVLRNGFMGDQLAAIAVENGWRGVVINGAIRDSAGIDRLPIGVKALGTTARKNWTAGPFAQDCPVTFGGVTFAPGDWVYADQDCVILAKEELPFA